MKVYDTGSCRLAYERVGAEEEAPLLFLHGATVDHVSMMNTFEPYFQGPGNGRSRTYLDLPGHGGSDYSLLRANMPGVLEEVGAFVRGNFTRPPCIVGYSMGAFLALKLAETTPFPALFLIAPPVYTDKARIARPAGMGIVADDLNEEDRQGADRRYLLMSAKKNADTLKRYRANLAPSFSPGQWLYQTTLFRNASADDLTIDPARIVSRAVFLVGQQDLLVGYRDQFELSEKLMFSEYHSFSDCGHFLPVECELFGDLFVNWLRSAGVKPGPAGGISARPDQWLPLS